MVLDVDLNALPTESRQHDGDATHIDLPHEHIISHESPGPCTSINAAAIDDDVVFLTSYEWTPRDNNQSRRKSPVTIVIDEKLETDIGPSGVEEPATTLSLSSQTLRQISLGKRIIDCDSNANENCISMTSNGKNPIPDACNVASAPTTPHVLTCPVCWSVTSRPSSTICGHLFCGSCIQTAVTKHKKCPACRRKLTKKSFHRIYLP